ncbi:MAG: glycoside hydrolase family 3 protein [Planctomycetota bacterium]|jgi:beta-N-acetylhexosaminidase
MNEAVARRIDEIMGRMSLAEKVGQCYTLNFTGCAIRSYHRRYVQEFSCGGLRVTPHVIPEVSRNHGEVLKPAPYCQPEDYTAVLRELQQMALDRNGIPLHLVTDQEGDLSIDFLRGGLNLFPSNMGMAATGDPGLVRQAAEAIARQLRAHGINWMHSPELDVNVQPENPEVGMRAFSDDPDICAEFGIAMAKGFLAGGVMPTAKHFPGRGDSVLDAHDTLDVLDKPLDKLHACELHPYKQMIADGTPFAIMTAHNAYTALDDPTIPASMSRKINVDLIRNELGFEGVVTTDAISMAGALAYAGTIPKACLLALKAGADLVLLKSKEWLSEEAISITIDAVTGGEIPEEELDRKVRRILAAKFDLGLFDGDILPDPARTLEPARSLEVISVCNETFEKCAIVTRDRDGLLPLAKDAKVLVVEQYIALYHDKCNDRFYHPSMFGEYMRQYGDEASVISLETGTPATEEQAVTVISRFDAVDVVVFNNIFWRGSGSNRALIREAVKRGKKVIVTTNDLYDSYFLPTVGTVVCTFGAVPRGVETAARIVYGDLKARGKWPLRLVEQSETVDPGDIRDHSVAGHFSTR